jgi:gluconolactonase
MFRNTDRHSFSAVPHLLVLMLLGTAVAAGDDNAPKTKNVEAGDLHLAVPETWKQKGEVRYPRIAEFQIPAAGDDKSGAEFVVFYFGKQGAGGLDANIGRWVSQFEEEGRQVRIVTGDGTQGKYTLVDLSGTYRKPVGPPVLRKSTSKPGWRVLNVFVETEAGPYFLKIDGPQMTIAAAENDIRASFGGKKETEKERKKE